MKLNIHSGLVTREESSMMKLPPMAAMAMSNKFSKKVIPATKSHKWHTLNPEEMAQVEACLDDAAKTYGCKRNELVWSMSPEGMVKVKKRERVVVP